MILIKKFRFLSIEFVRVMASMQEILNLMLARLAVLATLLCIAYGQTKHKPIENTEQ